jgi:hypothetical protein
MAHYAFLDDNNIVTEVIVGIDETETIEGLDTETWYGDVRNQTCLRTSYNAKIRGKFAGIGDSYLEIENIFIEPQPYSSWVRVGCYWEAPVPIPSILKSYVWNEAEIKWDELEGTPHELS